MIDRETFGSASKYKVLDFIYDYFDKSDKKTKNKISKTILYININIKNLYCISGHKFRAQTGILYKKEIEKTIIAQFDDADLKNRLLNLVNARYSEIIKNSKLIAYKKKMEIQREQRLKNPKKI